VVNVRVSSDRAILIAYETKTPVGDTVNIASRLQELNKVHHTEIILSGATSDRLSGDLSLTLLPETSLKGIARPISLYTL